MGLEGERGVFVGWFCRYDVMGIDLMQTLTSHGDVT